MKLLPFDFEESCRYFNNMSDEDKALIYGIVGGTPQYLLQISDKLSVEENIKNTYLNPMSFLYEEPTNLLKQEVREPAIYTAIIGATDMVYKRIEPELSNYMGRVYEEICMQYLWKQLLEGNAPIEFVSLGRWWGNDPIQKVQAEIDVMGEQDSDAALFAECKWRNEKVDLDILETLIGRSKLFRYTTVHYYLFSKSGFTKGCMEKTEEMGNVTLVSYADIVASMKKSDTFIYLGDVQKARRALFGGADILDRVRVLMTRGVEGLYLYACDDALREALLQAMK